VDRKVRLGSLAIQDRLEPLDSRVLLERLVTRVFLAQQEWQVNLAKQVQLVSRARRVYRETRAVQDQQASSNCCLSVVRTYINHSNLSNLFVINKQNET